MQLKGLENFNLREALKKELKGIVGVKNAKLEIGFFESAKYQNGAYVASVAKWQEFGTLNIPPRPFFRTAIYKQKVKWLDTLKNQLVSNGSLEVSLNQVGEVAKGDIMQSITKLNNPINAKSTIKAKGSSNPLIDTGFLRASVSYKVTE